jgi:hypothetical protein
VDRPVDAKAPPPAHVALVREVDAILAAIAGVPIDDPAKAEAELARRVPPRGPAAKRVETLASEGARDGWLLTRRAGTVEFGRLAKDVRGHSVDVVRMEGSGAGHTHTNGEVNLGFVVSGDPRFDGRPAGWVVFPPGSHHVPTVTGGTMLILYFVPGGKVAWDPPPAAPSGTKSAGGGA